jgi:hypothetical protein
MMMRLRLHSRRIDMTTKARLFLCTVGVTLGLIAAQPRSAVAQSTAFFPLTPCRVIDTRNISAPILLGGQTRSFSVKGTCGIPADAKGISYNLTAINTSQPGFMTMFPHGIPKPLVAAIVFPAGATLGNGGVVGLTAGSPDLSIFLDAGQAHAAVDVTGYFKVPTP